MNDTCEFAYFCVVPFYNNKINKEKALEIKIFGTIESYELGRMKSRT